MDSAQTIFWMIGACALLICLLLFSKQLRFLVKFIFRAVAGLFAVHFTNLAIGPLIGSAVGVNALNGFIMGVLGAPGFVLLYIAGYFL